MLQSVSRASITQDVQEQIPRILHRVMLPREDGGVDCDGDAEQMMKMTRNHFHNNNPGWSEYIWGIDAIERLLNSSAKMFAGHEGLEDFSSTFKNMDEWIYQQDTIRHLILFHYGGLYMDLDIDCTGDVSPFLDGASLVLRAKAKTNFMATKPRHPFSVDMMRRIGGTFKTLDPVVANRPTAIWLTGEKQIGATLLATGINATIDEFPHGKVFTTERFGNVRIVGTLQVENTPAVATCVHGMQNSWHNKEGIVPATAKHPKSEVELARTCQVLYDDRTLWGSELIKWVKTLEVMYEFLGSRQ